jgi:hypothetical protein
MRLYIPEIGDTFTLAEDWRFILHAENRNQDLAAWAGYYLIAGSPTRFVDPRIVPPMRPRDYEVDYSGSQAAYRDGKNWNSIEALRRQEELACPEWVKYWDDYREWQKDTVAKGVTEISVTLPAGTILKVDRIYIRKGQGDYSSITFFAEGLGETIVPASGQVSARQYDAKKKKLRFWAKLSDVNTMTIVNPTE